MSNFDTLAAGVAGLGEHAQQVEGQLAVLTCAVAAMLQTHPDHAAFAAAFRRAWLLAGSQHSNSEAGPQALAGIDSVLYALEEACLVPLNIRPS